MTEPRPIEPQDIRVGMRVRVAWTKYDAEVTAEFTVGGNDPSREQIVTAGDGPLQWFGWTPGTWTLLADAPAPDRPVGSHWRDPETGAEYVKTDIGDRGSHYLAYTQCRSLGANSTLIPEWSEIDDAIIARLTPIPAFDPAVLWPPAERFAPPCREDCDRTPEYCQRQRGHSGPHACYKSDGTVWFVWGVPR